uniref:Putative conserved secreted protein n=1 Tax=Ixodes scapularis TaxID=6945 RepID=A0A4D5RWD1_IXOSC
MKFLPQVCILCNVRTLVFAFTMFVCKNCCRNVFWYSSRRPGALQLLFDCFIMYLVRRSSQFLLIYTRWAVTF